MFMFFLQYSRIVSKRTDIVDYEYHPYRLVPGGERERRLLEFDPLDIAFLTSNSAGLLNHILQVVGFV